MKDPYLVLWQRQEDLKRVRREVEALRIAIHLLADDEVTVGMPPSVLVRSSDDVRDELETYYPFARHLRLAGDL